MVDRLQAPIDFWTTRRLSSVPQIDRILKTNSSSYPGDAYESPIPQADTTQVRKIAGSVTSHNSIGAIQRECQ
jgi:hypothetical protein